MNIKRNLAFLSIFTLVFGQLSAAAFTPYSVENEAKVLLYWGDVEENTTTGSNLSFDGTIQGQNGRVLALQSVAFESSDKLTHKDSRATGEVEFESNITAGVDGLLLLISENETQLQVDMDTLGTHNINLSTLKSSDFEFDSGNFGLRAKYLGKDFLSTPTNPGSTSSFSDVPTSEWFFKYTERIKDLRVQNQPIFEGYKTATGNLTGRFGPADNITVGEMLKVVLRVSGHDENNNNLDASLQGSTHWSVGFQNTAIDLDLTIMQAVGINPDRPVIRGEFFQALAEAQGLMSSNNYNCNITDLDFDDLDSSNPYTKYACILVKDGIISGTDDGYLNLNNNINRAEVAKILNTALDIYVEQPSNVQASINTVINLDDSNESNNAGGGAIGGVVSDLLVQNSIPNSATKYYEVKSSTGLQINTVDNNKISIQSNGQTYTGSQIDSVKVNNQTILRVKINNTNWETESYTVTFSEGAISFTDGTVNAASTLNFDVNLATEGAPLTWDIQEVNYNSSLMSLRLDVDDSNDIDLSNDPKTAVDILRDGGVPILSIQVAKAFDDNDLVIVLETDDSETEAFAGGEYQIDIDGLQYENGLNVPAFQSTFTVISSFLSEGTHSSQITPDQVLDITYPNNGSAVRMENLTFTLEKAESTQGGTGVDYVDITSELNISLTSTGKIRATRKVTPSNGGEWDTGYYILTATDGRLSETHDYQFQVN